MNALGDASDKNTQMVGRPVGWLVGWLVGVKKP